MKFLEDTNATSVKQDDQIFVVMTRAEARIVGEALEAHAGTNKRKSSIKRVSQDWNDLGSSLHLTTRGTRTL